MKKSPDRPPRNPRAAANARRTRAAAWRRREGRTTRTAAARIETAEAFTDHAFSWQRVSVQMLPEMQWQLKARAAQEQTHMREVLHRAIVAYLQTPLPAPPETR